MQISRRGLLKASGIAIVSASLGSEALPSADVLVLHEGDAQGLAWLATLRQSATGRIEARQLALLKRGALAYTAEWLASHPERRFLALIGDGEAVVLEAALRQTGASAFTVARNGQRVLIDARL